MGSTEMGALVSTLVKSALRAFYAPIVVRTIAGGFEIVDGEHRLAAWKEAARQLQANGVEVDADMIPAVVTDMLEDEARFYRLSLNRIRGNPDLDRVAVELRALNESMGLSELMNTGFEQHEIKHLLEDHADLYDTEAILAGASASFPEPAEPAERERVFELTLRFTSSAQLKKAKQALRKAAGKGAELGDGLIRILEGD
jgi:ParB-like chromosome segregation protein Spo0J